MSKYTIKEVGEIIDNEGLGYAIQNYMRGSSIKDPVLAKMWDDCADLLDKITKYVENGGNY